MIKNRIVGSGFERPDQLLAHPHNLRTHPKAQQDAVMGLLNDVGWVQNIIVNRRTQTIVDGHMRVSLAMRDGIESVPVTYVDLSEREESLVLALLDKTSSMALIDERALDELLRTVTTGDPVLMELLEAMAVDAEAIPADDVEDDNGAPAHETRCPNCGHTF